MIESRQFTWPTYLVGIALIVIPLADVLTSLYPWRFLEPRWRFGAVGLISNSLLIPTAGLLVAFVISVLRDHRIARRIIGVVGLIGATISLLVLLMFALDAVQTRATVSREMRPSFNVASIAAAIKTLVAGATFLMIGVAAFRERKERVSEVKSSDMPFLAVQPTAVNSARSGDQST